MAILPVKSVFMGSGTRTEVEHDLAEKITRLHRPKRFDRFTEWIDLVDDGPDTMFLDRGGHAGKHRLRPYRYSLKLRVLADQCPERQGFLSAAEHPDNRDLPAERQCVEALSQIARAAHAKNEIDAGGADRLFDFGTPLRMRAIIDDMRGTKGLGALKLFVRGGGDDHLQPMR